MKATIRDKEILNGLRPLEVASYLRVRGWQQAEYKEGALAIWELAGPDEKAELGVPLNPEFRDYALRMAEILRTLEKIEGRSQLDIAQDIHTVQADVIRIKPTLALANGGSAPLDLGVSTLTGARDLMVAATVAAIEKRPILPNRRPARAEEYLKTVRIASLEGGEFGAMVLSPIPLTLADAGLQVPPFARRVSQTLASALEATRQAAEQATARATASPFREAVKEGASLTLIQAILGMMPEGLVRSVEISISWARAASASWNLTTRPSRTVFTPDFTPSLKSAAALFKESTSLRDVEIEGPVVAFNQEREPGIATIVAQVGGDLRKVQVPISTTDRPLVIEALENWESIACEGDLVREGKTWKLQNARRFRLLGADWG